MTNGIAEQGAKVATSFFDSMKSQPLALALVVMNLVLLLLFFYVVNLLSDRARERETALFEEQKEVRGLLSKCVVPQGQQLPDLTPTFIAVKVETREQRLKEVLEPQAPLLDLAGEKKINSMLQKGLDDALHDQIKHLFEVWLRDETEQPRRASVGARAAIRAYRDAVRALQDRERKIEKGESVP